MMHQQGINIQSLGIIANTAKLPHVRELACAEMIARVCKKLLRDVLQKTIIK